MAQTARVTLTLSNIATEEDLRSMEERIMSQLSDAVASIRTAVEGVAGRMGDPGAIEAAVAAERARYDVLVSSEAAEDVAQDADLQAARAEVDRLINEQTAAAGELVTLADQLNAVGTAVEETPDETPVGEVPVEIPAPDAEVQAPAETPVPDAGVPADGGAPAEATPTTDAPSSPTTTDEAATTAGTPADAAPATGVTDASGNPVPPPAI